MLSIISGCCLVFVMGTSLNGIVVGWVIHVLTLAFQEEAISFVAEIFSWAFLELKRFGQYWYNAEIFSRPYKKRLVWMQFCPALGNFPLLLFRTLPFQLSFNQNVNCLLFGHRNEDWKKYKYDLASYVLPMQKSICARVSAFLLLRISITDSHAREFSYLFVALCFLARSYFSSPFPQNLFLS